MTDQAPELLQRLRILQKHERIFCSSYQDICKEAADEIERLRALTRPPSERPVAQMREGSREFEDAVLAAVHATMPTACVELLTCKVIGVERAPISTLDFAREILRTIALTAERPEAAVAWLCEYDGHTDATTSRDTMCQWKDTLGRKITPLYAIQHEEPGRETMTSVTGEQVDSGRSLPESSEPSLLGRTGGEIIGYCGWHPDRGYNFPTMAETVQGATSLMLRTGLASGNHRWEILPLYYSASPSLLGRETVREALVAAQVALSDGARQGARCCDDLRR